MSSSATPSDFVERDLGRRAAAARLAGHEITELGDVAPGEAAGARQIAKLARLDPCWARSSVARTAARYSSTAIASFTVTRRATSASLR
jgi:hypothetical protein